jgi:hypothetical protein
MKLKLKASLLAAVVAITAITIVAAPAVQAAAPSKGSVQVPVTGTATGGTFAGAYTITQFKTVNGALYAVGTLTGTVTDSTGTVVNTLTNVPVTIPASAAGGSCSILDLTLGPLHLDLLGLVVDLNQVHLTITAQQGSGNLLGNLLCDVANLLNSNSTTGLSGLLNQILGQL